MTKLFQVFILLLGFVFSRQQLLWEKFVVADKSMIPTYRRDVAIGYYSKENSLYIFGGRSNRNQPLNDMYRFDLRTNIWTLIHAANSLSIKARYGMVYGTTDDFLYIATGKGTAIATISYVLNTNTSSFIITYFAIAN